MQTTRRTAVAFGLSVMCAAGLAAQTQETKTTTKTKVEVKGGKNVKVVGCLDRGANGDYLLTKLRTKHLQDPAQYALVTSEDLSKHVGERLEVRGNVVSEGNGKVSIESEDEGRGRTWQGFGNQVQDRRSCRVQDAVSRRDVDKDARVILQLTRRQGEV